MVKVAIAPARNIDRDRLMRFCRAMLHYATLRLRHTKPLYATLHLRRAMPLMDPMWSA